MKLLVDIGNSRIKWAVYEAGMLNSSRGVSYMDKDLPSVFDHEWGELATPDRVLVSNVGGSDAAGQLRHWTEYHWQITPEFAMVTSEACGVMNTYDDVSQLGIDRWLAVIAVWNKYRSAACIVDCGSAITVDGLRDDGGYMGGVILPGMAMMRQSLYTQARGIQRRENITDPMSGFARNTDQGIANGCIMAIGALIDRIAQDMQNEFDAGLACVITGGYAEKIIKLLSTTFIHEPNLVFEGLQLCLGNDS